MEPDMAVLSADKRIRALDLNEPWLAYIAYAFLPQGLGFTRYVTRTPDPEIRDARAALRGFLRAFLPHFYRCVPAACLVRTDLKLQSDYDWSAISEQVGVRYVLLQRENLLGQGAARLERRIQRDRAIGNFEGSHIITYNKQTKDLYVDCGVARSDIISALGCLRMDPMLHRLCAPTSAPGSRRITLFAIRPNVLRHSGDPALKRMIEDVYSALAELILMRPGLSVVVKIKTQFVKDRLDKSITAFLRSRDFDMDKLTGLSFTAEGDAHSHIMASDVVIGMRSTTLLEAAVSGRPVVLPLFEGLRTTQYMDEMTFIDDLAIFDMPGNKAEFKSVIERRLDAPIVEEALMRRRWEVFEKYFHARDGRARDRIVRKLLDVIGNEAADGLEPVRARSQVMATG